MPVGLLNRVQSLEAKLEEVTDKCSRLEKENSSLRDWVQELQQGLASAKKSFSAVQELQQEVAQLRNQSDGLSPKSSDSAGSSRRGVSFRPRESVVEIDGRGSLGNFTNGAAPGESQAPRKVKSRKPTAFAPAPPASGVGFEGEEDVEEVEVDQTPKRKVHGRQATAFAPKRAADVDFDDDAEEVDVEEDTGGPKRSVHGRQATAFVPRRAAASVEFEDDAEDVEEVEVDKTPKRKVHGRQPTAFVPKAKASAGVNFENDVEEVDGDDGDDDDGAPKRNVHGRKATAFVPKGKPMASVEFEDEDDDVDEVEVDQTPKRSVHGRQATAFVKKAKASTGQVAFEDAADEVDVEEDGGPKRSAHGRKATAFVPKSRASPGVSFHDDAEEVELEAEEGDGPRRSAHGRKATAFVPKAKATAVSFAAEQDHQDEQEGDEQALKRSPKKRQGTAFVPKLPLAQDDDEDSSPNKREVRFRGNDSVNETHEDAESGQIHAMVRKRVPTKFIDVKESAQDEDEEDTHAHVRFADEVSESDDDDDGTDSVSTAPTLRKARARVPTAFAKEHEPVEDDGSLTREELLELNRQPDQRPARPRLPTAFTQTGVAGVVETPPNPDSPRFQAMMSSMPEHMKEMVFSPRDELDLQKHAVEGATKDKELLESILRKLLYFKDVDQETLQKLIAAMEVFRFPDGTQVSRQGSFRGTHFFIVSKGTLVVLRNGETKSEITTGAAFGENVILMSGAQDATIQAKGEVEIYGMHGAKTRALFAEQYQRERGQASSAVNEALSGEPGNREMSIISTKVNVLGFENGATILEAGQKRARAALRILDMLVLHASQGKKLQWWSDHPFIIKFVRSFNSARHVYFLTELVTGGELLDALDALGLLQAPQAQFYSASIILALEFLHERRIAYLDLKGENCLIDQHGYLKIIDFGVAERITDGRIYAVWGTPLFMAPEVILGKGYTTSADLWSLGVCLFDFMVGSFPFGDDQASNAEIFKAVLKAPLKFPKWLGVHEKDAKELMKALLCRDPAKRLGAGQRGYEELKDKGGRWEGLLARQLDPPFVPKGETYAEDAEIGKDVEPGTLTVLEEDDGDGDDDWFDPDPSWADEF
ncbi:PRKG1 [Symbiodinium natans]|uniref:cGMP-dependent protein kinase n=1 Tax=Symbiodinium natans TaxID=878477 RepID=A0A812PQI1_9DINO|nr:PRKG1 [Symbiodinium natans]